MQDVTLVIDTGVLPRLLSDMKDAEGHDTSILALGRAVSLRILPQGYDREELTGRLIVYVPGRTWKRMLDRRQHVDLAKSYTFE